jgi:flavoprotein
MSQLVVYPYATSEEISVSSSNKLAVATYGEGGAKVYQKTTAPNYPGTWSLLFTVNNEERVYSFSADAVIRIDAGADKVFYSCTSANPSAVEFQPQVPRTAHQYFNDFDAYVSGDWTVTKTGAGGSAALTDVVNGFLLLTTDTADNDNVFLQKLGESFLFQSGKRLGFEARLKVSNATQCDFIMGLQKTDTTPLAVSDGVYFIKNDDVATLDFVVVASSTATTTSAIATLANDTLVTIGFYYDGSSTLNYYVNRVLVSSSAITNLPTTEELCVSFGIQAGSAGAKTMSVDYIYDWNDR